MQNVCIFLPYVMVAGIAGTGQNEEITSMSIYYGTLHVTFPRDGHGSIFQYRTQHDKPDVKPTSTLHVSKLFSPSPTHDRTYK